jgi:hypothetical protein
VIGLRLAKLAGGGVDAQHEAYLILGEKVDAVFEAPFHRGCERRAALGYCLDAISGIGWLPDRE